MNQAHAIWNTDNVRAAAACGDYGAVVRAVRRAGNLTLTDLAARTNYSAATLSRLERGKQHLTDVHVLRILAEALHIPPPLLGLADTPAQIMRTTMPAAIVGHTSTPDEETEMRRRTLLTGLTGLAGTAALATTPTPATPDSDPLRQLEYALLVPPSAVSAAPTQLSQLRRRLAAARTDFDLGRYAVVAEALTDLVPTAIATHAAQRGNGNVAVLDAELARVYILASQLSVKLGRDHLAWTSADRAMQAAHGSDDVLTHTVAHRAWAIVLRRTGHATIASRLITDTATNLQRHLHCGPLYLATYGSLLSTAAYTAAVDGDRDTAHTLLGDALEAAARLDRCPGPPTGFGPTAAGLYRISIARVLGDAGAAIDAARHIDPTTIHSAERRARFWTDVARA